MVAWLSEFILSKAHGHLDAPHRWLVDKAGQIVEVEATRGRGVVQDVATKGRDFQAA